MSLQKSYKMQSCSWCYFSHPITERLQNLREEVGNNERDTIRRTSVRGFIHNLDLQKVKIALILKPRLSYTNHRICNANAIWRIFNPNFFMSDGKPHLETFLNHVWLLLLTDSVVCDDEEMHNKIFMNFLRRHRSMKSMQDEAKLMYALRNTTEINFSTTYDAASSDNYWQLWTFFPTFMIFCLFLWLFFLK